MVDSQSDRDRGAVDRVIALVEAALCECDEHGFIYAAIDLCSAIDKLKLLRDQSGAD